MADALMAKLTGSQTGGTVNGDNIPVGQNQDIEQISNNGDVVSSYSFSRNGGRRHRKSHKGNSWLAHVKATMKLHPGKSFKQVLKIAKKTYKRSQSSSQSGGKGRKGSKGKGKSQKNYQNGGSGGKMDGVGKYATPV